MDHFEDFTNFLLAVYQYVMLPVSLFILRPIFLGINRVLGCISWLYGFRVTLMVQGLVCYWRAFLYFERSSLWAKLVENHEKHDKSYIIPLFWTMNGFFLIFIILIVLVATLAGEENVRRAFNIQGKVGFNLYYLGKSTGELSILNLMVFIGDHVADKSVAEMNIASCFVCGYLSLISLIKLCHVGNDLGLADGIASVIVCIFTHYSKTGTQRVSGIFICWFFIWGKNILFTDCCRPCSEAAIIGLPVGDGGGGAGEGGTGGGGGGAAGGGPGGGGAAGGGPGSGGAAGGRDDGRKKARYRGTSSEVVIPIGGQTTEVFHSARSSSAKSV